MHQNWSGTAPLMEIQEHHHSQTCIYESPGFMSMAALMEGLFTSELMGLYLRYKFLHGHSIMGFKIIINSEIMTDTRLTLGLCYSVMGHSAPFYSINMVQNLGRDFILTT